MSAFCGLDRVARASNQRRAVRQSQTIASYLRPDPRLSFFRDGLASRATPEHDVHVRRLDDGSTLYSFGDSSDGKASRGPADASKAQQRGDVESKRGKASSGQQHSAKIPSPDGSGASKGLQQPSKDTATKSRAKEATEERGRKQTTRRRSTGAGQRRVTGAASPAAPQRQPSRPTQPPRRRESDTRQPPSSRSDQHRTHTEAQYAAHALPSVALMEQLVGVEPTSKQASQNGAAVAVAEPPVVPTTSTPPAPAQAHVEDVVPPEPKAAAHAKNARTSAKGTDAHVSAADSASHSAAQSGTVQDLNTLTVKELTALCKERGIKGYSSLRKAELVELVATQP